MASSDHPTTPEQGSVFTPGTRTGATEETTSIQAPPETPSNPAIPLPSLPQPPARTIEKFTQIRDYLDAVLAALVLVFAFLVASFPATNPDFFRQLATGRMLIQGEYHFGVDPFTYTSEGVYWANHSWLFALLVYALYQIPVIGNAAVVVCKALLVATLAEIMLRISRRPGQSLWIPAACTMLAILALSPRLFLQSICLSFLFLGLTLWLLNRPRQIAAAMNEGETNGTQTRSSLRSWWLIPPLFALWVNCDQWFFVGPLAVALYLGGELLQQWLPLAGEKRDDSRRRELGTLVVVLVAGLAACLINPHHIHAFTLPPELGLSPAADLIENDAQFRTFFLSPVRKYYYNPRLGLSVAGLSFLPLLLLGVVSFAFTLGRVPWWRLVVWTGFAFLSLYNARAIPFFAIVAGPIAALNWLDYAAYRLGRAPRLTPAWQQWSLGGRALTALLGVALLVATVPGWLQAQPHETHRVGWCVAVDPSLEQAAKQIKTWRDEEQLPADTHWFSTDHAIANYLSWFAPGERAFLDQRLPLFRKTASDYLDIRESLEHMAPSGNAEEEGAGRLVSSRKDWRKIFQDQNIHFWIVDGSASHKAGQVARLTLFGNPDEWTLHYLHGRIAIFSRKGAWGKNPQGPLPKEINLERLAFGVEAEQAPPRGPENLIRPNDWWTIWWEPKPPAALDRDTASLHDDRYLASRERFSLRNSRTWNWAVAAATVGGNALQQGPVPNSLLEWIWSWTYNDLFSTGAPQQPRPLTQREQHALIAQKLYVNSQDSGPPDSLYLAVRAARRALLVDPEDAQTYMLLARAYQRLGGATQERPLSRAFPQLAGIRLAQMVAALQNCLRCKPSPKMASEAHGMLADVFIQSQYLDIGAYHIREQLRYLQILGPQPAETVENHKQMIADLTKKLDSLDNFLKTKVDEYEVNAANKPVLEKARIALERGLADKAREELSSVSDAGVLFGRSNQGGQSGLSMLLELVLNMGRLDDANALLTPPLEGREQPIQPAFLSFHLRLAAARGDYEAADGHLADVLNHKSKDSLGRPWGAEVGILVGFLASRTLLAEAQHLTGSPSVPWVPNNPSDMFRQPLVGQSPSDFWIRRWRLEAIENSLHAGQQQAELYFLRGWFALEAGRCVEAGKHFQTALDTIVPRERWMPEISQLNAFLAPQEFNPLRELMVRQSTTRQLCQYYLKWLNANQS